jgi:hypothetical protein
MLPESLLLLGSCVAIGQTPLDWVRREVLELQNAPRQRVAPRLVGALDLEAIAQAVLPDASQGLTDERRRQFIDALRARLLHRARQGSRQIVRWRLRSLRQRGLEVHGIVEVARRGEKHAFDLAIRFVRRESGCHGVLDVTVDEVSFLRNLRARVRRLLERKGWDEMIRLLGERK